MASAADSAEVADAVGPSPSDASLRGLDGVNLLLAGALSGFGPYVAAFLAEQNWTQQSIGFVLTAGGFAGLLSQWIRRNDFGDRRFAQHDTFRPPGREPWPRCGISGHRDRGPRRCTSPVAADA
jgi:hypothetical protein